MTFVVKTIVAAAAYSYDAWGKITLQNDEEASNRHKFTGREWDAEIGLQYNRARFYDPEIGRFITQDPLTKGPDDPTVTYYSGVYSVIHRYLKDYIDALEPHKTNRYVYCTNNPINKVDPLGLADDKDKTEGVKAAAKDEQTGDTKAQEAGKPDRTGTEQKGKTSEDTKKDQGAETKQPSGTAPVETTKPGETKQETPQPAPAPCPVPVPVDTRSPKQEAVDKNLEAKGGLPQRGAADLIHETLNPPKGGVSPGTAADIIQGAALAVALVCPELAPAAWIAFTTSGTLGSGLKATDALIAGNYGKAAWAAGELTLGTYVGRAVARAAGLESASFNWGSMRYHSTSGVTKGDFVTNAAGRAYDAVRYGTEAAVSVPSAISEYKKPENP